MNTIYGVSASITVTKCCPAQLLHSLNFCGQAPRHLDKQEIHPQKRKIKIEKKENA